MKDNTVIVIVAIMGVVVLDSIALMNGINGTFLALSFTTIGGFIGYVGKSSKDIIKKGG
jgi:hypothetical protein